MKCSTKTLQNLPYFWNTKTHIVFSFFISCYFIFFPRALIREKNVAWNKKRKTLRGFLYSKNMANFEAFCQNFSSSINHFFSEEWYVNCGRSASWKNVSLVFFGSVYYLLLGWLWNCQLHFHDTWLSTLVTYR